MVWWINVILGILIGSFLACYVPIYREGFKAVLGRLANAKSSNKSKAKK